MMDVFDGRCAILEPMMRECGAFVRETKHWQHPDCDCRTCGNTKTVKLDVETNDIVDEKMWTQHNVIDPLHKKLVGRHFGSCPDHFPEASLSIVAIVLRHENDEFG